MTTRNDALEEAIRIAIDLLAMRTYGSPARSPGHNARMALESALKSTPAPPSGDYMSTQEITEALWGGDRKPPVCDLLPCPFCGGEAERGDVPNEDTVDGGANAGGSYIQCKQCAASTALHFDRKENLVSSWNRRTAFRREPLAVHLAALDNIILKDIRSTVGPAEDAHNWREYLGRADDLLARISEEMSR